MNRTEYVKKELNKSETNELIFARKVYSEAGLSEHIKEMTYYKILERMCGDGELCKLSKGIYYRPEKTRFGNTMPSEAEIVGSFIKNNSGMVVGYHLYNSLNLTTQISKNIEVYTNTVVERCKHIKNISVYRVSIDYSEEIVFLIQFLEVLKNFESIQDLDMPSFFKFCEKYSSCYSDDALGEVISQIRYGKSVLSFLREILEYFNVENTVSTLLSPFSTYSHPSMEDIYEAAFG